MDGPAGVPRRGVARDPWVGNFEVKTATIIVLEPQTSAPGIEPGTLAAVVDAQPLSARVSRGGLPAGPVGDNFQVKTAVVCILEV